MNHSSRFELFRTIDFLVFLGSIIFLICCYWKCFSIICYFKYYWYFCLSLILFLHNIFSKVGLIWAEFRFFDVILIAILFQWWVLEMRPCWNQIKWLTKLDWIWSSLIYFSPSLTYYIFELIYRYTILKCGRYWINFFYASVICVILLFYFILVV